ncbi:MAG: hypothetical protein ACTHNM_17160 [Dyella sp.]|uniref:hypothetical protein n=1 Tax=Dyella sp. TaxID=1869338 RepID=UPI003F819A81
MARKSNARTAEELNAVEKTINHEALEQAGRDLAETAQRLTVIEQQFGMDMPYNLHLYKARIRDNMAETAKRLVEIGVMLIHMREHESPSDFRRALEDLEMGERFARKAMQGAAKVKDKPRIQMLGSSKALELLTEDEDDLAQLENGGTFAGLTLDEIDTMSVRELKAALRAERAERQEEKATDEEIIRAKDERINKLTRDKRRAPAQDALRSKANMMLAECDEAAVKVVSLLAKMRALHADVEQIYAEANTVVEPDVDQRMEANLRWAADQLRDLAEHLGE